MNAHLRFARALRIASGCVLIALTLTGSASAAGTVLLKTSWLQAHKNLVTATSSCRIDTVHKTVNGIKSGGDDGDLHMACRCDDVGLPMVAEIVNAAMFSSAATSARTASRTKTPTQITGVWRFWLEHPATKPQTQGAKVPVPTDTDPDHSFEIHPITALGTIDLSGSFVPIPGYSPYLAKKAFDYYEQRTFTVSRSGIYTAIEGTKAKFNYAGFQFTVAGTPQKVADGWFVFANIDGIPGDPRRMVVPAGTAPAGLVVKAKKGMRYRAVGIPRIDLKRVDDEVTAHPGVRWPVTGAYEMILVSMAAVH